MLVDAPGALMIVRCPLNVFENFITRAKSPVKTRSAKSANEQLEANPGDQLQDGEAMLLRAAGAADQVTVTFPTVGLEKKEGKWVGFAFTGTRVEDAQWIWVEITGKKMKYKAQFYAQARSWDQKEVEVKLDKEKKYTFDGGYVEYSGQSPFDAGTSWTLIIIVIVSVVLFLIAIIVAAFVEEEEHSTFSPPDRL